ncbi:hypothetical protein BHM03_00062185 [Ensete ventricosum]|nr:hypothetical protein BHM03_00062185 [Ensete ventricosum]
MARGAAAESGTSRIAALIPIDDSEEEVHEVTEEEPQPTDCMMHALAGYANSQTMKVRELLKQQPITILTDTGSTNDFINSKVVARMALDIKDCSRFDVKIADD